MTRAYDVIGDVHGQFDKLVALLTHLGYRDYGGTWRHPDRSVIFVGDLIDLGPAIGEVIEIVEAMVSSGVAQIVMGNNECLGQMLPDCSAKNR